MNANAASSSYWPLPILGSVVVVLRWGAGALSIGVGLWLSVGDLIARARAGRRDFPHENVLFHVWNTRVGYGFWLGMAAMVLGLLLLPLT